MPGTYQHHKGKFGWFRFCLLAALVLTIGQQVLAQSEYRSRVSLEAIQTGDDQFELKALFRARVGRSYVPISGVEIAFTVTRDSITQVPLGSAVTDDAGFAILHYDASPDADSGHFQLEFAAAFAGNDTIRNHSRSVAARLASLSIQRGEDDSLAHEIVVQLQAKDAEGLQPVEGVTVDLSVERMLSELPVSSESTEEDGHISFGIPIDLPGDPDGTLHIVARVTEDETYGSLITSLVIPKLPIEGQENPKRSLWTVAPPLWMLITFYVLMVAVWGHYVYILVQLARVNKEGRTANLNMTTANQNAL